MVKINKVYIILIAIILALIGHELYYNYMSDDAFISFRYSKNLINGHGLVYNIGDKVEGYTNFLWVLILSIAGWLKLDIVLASRFLGAIFSILTIIIVYRFGSKRYGVFHGLLAPTLLASSAAYAVWALSGLETMLFTFLVTAGAFRAVYEWDKKSKIPLSSFYYILAALTRPEGLLFLFGSCLYFIYKGVKHKQKRYLIPWLSGTLAIFVVLYLPYFIWRFNYYGYLLPNTFYAKTGGGLLQYIRGMYYVLKYVTYFGGVLLFLIPFGVFMTDKMYEWMYYLSAICIFWVLYIVWVGGDGLVCARFFVPISPFIYILMQEGLGTIIQKTALSLGKKRLLIIGSIIGVTLGTFSPSLNTRRDPYTEVIKEREMINNYRTIGNWLKINSEPNASIATYVAGAMPYYSDLRSIDMLGLNDIHIAHKKIEGMGKGSAGHEKKDFEYILKLKPTYIMTNWPTLYKVNADTIIDAEGVKYRLMSIKVGKGRIFKDYEMRSGDIWFNVWQKQN